MTLATTKAPAEIGQANLGLLDDEHLPSRELMSPAWPLKISVSLGLTFLLIVSTSLPALLGSPREIVVMMMALLPSTALAFALRLVFQGTVSREHDGSLRLITIVVAGLLACAGAMLSLGLAALVGAPVALAAGGATAGCLFGVMTLAATYRALEVRIGATSRRVYFLGSDAQHLDLKREVRRRGDLRVVGRLGLQEAKTLSISSLHAQIQAVRPTTLVMSGEAIRDESLVTVASQLHLLGLRIRTLNDFYEKHFAKVPVSDLSSAWFLFDVAEIHRARVYGVVKRGYEGVVASLLLTLAAPILPVIAAAVRLSSPGPVFFRQERVGKNGRLVRLTKFRTMTGAPAVKSAEWATGELTRITPLGRWLRKYRLDELPQLWHVVRGDLALVGPRPEQPLIVERLRDSIEFYPARHHVRPGLTGWAQVNHGYGGSLEDTLEKLQYEFFYIKHQSLRLDLLIIFATVRTVLLGSGR